MTKGIVIDESKCNGCGLCVEACHEGALAIVNGKAKMVREDYCDGLGHCLPACPQGAISFIDKCGCEISPHITVPAMSQQPVLGAIQSIGPGSGELRQWPIKLKLVPAISPIFREADILLAADCSAFSYSKMHDLIKGRAVAICCPKFETGLKEKFVELISKNETKSITVVRMTVPCCHIDRIAKESIAASGKKIPLKIITLDQRGSFVKIEE